MSNQWFKKTIKAIDLATNSDIIQKIPTITWGPKENLSINAILPQFLFFTLLTKLVLQNKNSKEDNGDPWGRSVFFRDLGVNMKLFSIIVADFFMQKLEIYCIYFLKIL